MSWVHVEHTSSLGKAQTYVGPLPTHIMSPTLTAAVDASMHGVIEQACQHVGQAIASHPEICSRCARTIMRSALGSPEDAAAIINGGKPGDMERYTKVWKAMGQQVGAVQRALAQLRTEAAAGRVTLGPKGRHPQHQAGSFISQDSDALDAEDRTPIPSLPPLERVKGSPYAHLYEQGGWPMKAGQWQDYKLCACGDPTDAKSEPTMIVSGVR